MTSMVLPFMAVTMSPGRWARLPGMFSTQGTNALTAMAGRSWAMARMAPIMAAPPAISYFIFSMPSDGLMEMPPVSKVTPLPTRPRWALPWGVTFDTGGDALSLRVAVPGAGGARFPAHVLHPQVPGHLQGARRSPAVADPDRARREPCHALLRRVRGGGHRRLAAVGAELVCVGKGEASLGGPHLARPNCRAAGGRIRYGALLPNARNTSGRGRPAGPGAERRPQIHWQSDSD